MIFLANMQVLSIKKDENHEMKVTDSNGIVIGITKESLSNH